MVVMVAMSGSTRREGGGSQIKDGRGSLNASPGSDVMPRRTFIQGDPQLYGVELTIRF
jgi:hypothetical protein